MLQVVRIYRRYISNLNSGIKSPVGLIYVVKSIQNTGCIPEH